MRFSTLELTRRPPVAELRLNRPDARNAVDQRMLAELDHAMADLRDDAEIRVVLVTAAGAAFSAGWDPDVTAAAAGQPFRSIELLPQPVIAVIEGDALSAGLELALACDIRVASERATFAMPDVAAGAVPSGGGTQRLPRLVGRTAAVEMILLGATVDVNRAYAIGLVNEVTAANGALARAEEIAASIASRGPLAVRYAKEAINRGLDMPLEQALRYETDLTIILQTTEDRAEGVRAFLEKRKPRFQGR